jgi:hypothetical protein
LTLYKKTKRKKKMKDKTTKVESNDATLTIRQLKQFSTRHNYVYFYL